LRKPKLPSRNSGKPGRLGGSWGKGAWVLKIIVTPWIFALRYQGNESNVELKQWQRIAFSSNQTSTSGELEEAQREAQYKEQT
jgi:hypothetical protein